MKLYKGKQIPRMSTSVIIKKIGNHTLELDTDQNGFKRFFNYSAHTGGSIVIYSEDNSQKFCCDSWAIPCQPMQDWINLNQRELLKIQNN